MENKKSFWFYGFSNFFVNFYLIIFRSPSRHFCPVNVTKNSLIYSKEFACVSTINRIKTTLQLFAFTSIPLVLNTIAKIFRSIFQ